MDIQPACKWRFSLLAAFMYLQRFAANGIRRPRCSFSVAHVVFPETEDTFGRHALKVRFSKSTIFRFANLQQQKKSPAGSDDPPGPFAIVPRLGGRGRELLSCPRDRAGGQDLAHII
ncbi:hypothetical protein [Neomesorhizobium albiziae]|uniref:hypothetical protein n=1 Tax=Neomesorhizobium albiziae TaxID=335020 RepID=UPI00122C8E49|nr:hypothetical protein [Mesorhizobium albiziae]